MQALRISAKTLGQLALPDACPRCFWTKIKVGFRLPWQIFPGIFSSLDCYQKNVVHAYHGVEGRFPPWLSGFGPLREVIPVPHHTRFQWYDYDSDILLTGVPDEMVRTADGSVVVLDYKTAKFTGTQDSLLPMYRCQLNAYGIIAEHLGFGDVSALGLVYFEPITDLGPPEIVALTDPEGCRMGFRATPLPIDLDPGMVPPLLRRAREIADLGFPPEGRMGCRDCQLTNRVVGLLDRQFA